MKDLLSNSTKCVDGGPKNGQIQLIIETEKRTGYSHFPSLTLLFFCAIHNVNHLWDRQNSQRKCRHFGQTRGQGDINDIFADFSIPVIATQEKPVLRSEVIEKQGKTETAKQTNKPSN